jgi:ABC-type transport system involved in multi-copper enzyme maturation permease subunit
MIKALALKELREIGWIALLGFVAQMMLVAGAIGVEPFSWFSSDGDRIPFHNDSAFTWSCFLGGFVAIALGLRQSTWEGGRGTYLFLLNRPIRRDTLFLMKIGTGLAVLLLSIALPVLLYACWALVPRTHPSPAEWSMTIQSWQLCLSAPLFYLGAFLSGLRPARWYGTRILPLLATVILGVALVTSPWLWLLVLPVLLAVYALLAANICFVARSRDF